MTHWTAFTFAVAWTLATLILALALFGLLCLLWPERRHHDGEDESLSDTENTARLRQR